MHNTYNLGFVRKIYKNRSNSPSVTLFNESLTVLTKTDSASLFFSVEYGDIIPSTTILQRAYETVTSLNGCYKVFVDVYMTYMRICELFDYALELIGDYFYPVVQILPVVW